MKLIQTMPKMSRVSWISLCVLMVSAAIPLTKRDGEEEKHDSNTFLEEEKVEVAMKESADDAYNETSRDGDDSNKHTAYNQTKFQQAIPKDDILAVISRLGNVTVKLHSDMRKIYHTYTKRHGSSKHINVIPSVWHHLSKNIPSGHLLKKASNTDNVMANKSSQATADVKKVISKDHNNTLNSTRDQQKGKNQIQQGHDKIESDDTTKPRENRTNTDSMLPVDANSTTPVEKDLTLHPYSSCQHVPGLYQPRWLQMVTMCPINWTELNTKTQCESWENLNTLTFMDEVTFLPVQDMTGIVYANVYCAMCHDVGALFPWKTSFLCDKALYLTFQMWDPSDLTFLYSYLPTSKCERQIIPSIPETVQDCENDLHQMSGNTRKNFDATTEAVLSSYPVSFNVLMNFDFTGHTHILFTANQQFIEEEYISRCQEGETFDPYSQSCRDLTCSRSYTLVGNKCIQTGNEPLSSEGITDLSQLRTVNLVSLQVNITFGDYVIMKYKQLEPNIVLQIANHLNISVERLKDVNITYELGSINGAAVRVDTLTEKEYSDLFPYHRRSQYATINRPQDGAEFWRADGSSNGDEPLKTEGFTDTNNTKDSFNATAVIPEVENTPNAEPSPTTFKTISTRSMGKRRENEQLPSNDNVDVMNDFLLFNISAQNLLFNKKLFQQAFKYSGTLVSVDYKNFFIYHFKSHDNSSDLYISAPVNDQNERICLLLKNSQSLDFLLKQNMVMRISFVLVPPDDPQSTEEGSETLLQKIDNLIYEQQFSLEFNGNKFDVVAVEDDREGTTDEQFCPWGVEYMVYDDEFMMLNMDNETLMYVNKTNSFISVGLFDLYMLFSGSNSAEQTNVTDMMQYAFVCFMPRIIENDCNRIDLPKDEYYVAGQNKSIIFEGKEYDIFEYRVLDQNTGRIQICVPPTFNSQDRTLLPHLVTIDSGCSTDFDEALKAEGYMTLVLGRISMLALSCVILTYLLFPSLRNLPGLNTMNLTICLLITQIIFAEGIGEDRHWLCTAVAISLHYTLLAAHFWMNVTSYDVYKTFANPIITTHVREKSKYFRRYALYAWGAPFIIVSFCVFVDFSKLFHGVSIGYWDATSSSTTDLSSENDNSTLNVQDVMVESRNTSLTAGRTIHSCWITQPLAALVAFGDIIMLIFLVNCIFFGKTIRSISKTAKITKRSLTTRHSNSSLNKTNRSEVMLYLRMSTVMGFTWVFGLSSSILSSFVKPPTLTACAVVHVLGILFIIFNTSQGIFIFVAFVCNRRVALLYKDLILRAKKFLGQNRRGNIFSISSIISSNKQIQ